VARYLLEHGADCEATDGKYGSTALHTASFNGHLEVAIVLLDFGANVNARNKNELTPLHYAASNGHVALARLILSRGGDPRAKSREGRTPLDKAEGHADMIALLREALSSAGAKPGDGSLIPAAVRNDMRGVLAALAAGEDVNGCDDDGWTALHYSASLGLLSVTRLLLERGASQAVEDYGGLTAAQVAAQAGRQDIVQSLKDWAGVVAAPSPTAVAAARAAAAAVTIAGGAAAAAAEEEEEEEDIAPPQDGEDEGEWEATAEDYERYAQYLDDDAEDAGAFIRSKGGAKAMEAARKGVPDPPPPPPPVRRVQPQAAAPAPAPPLPPNPMDGDSPAAAEAAAAAAKAAAAFAAGSSGASKPPAGRPSPTSATPVEQSVAAESGRARPREAARVRRSTRGGSGKARGGSAGGGGGKGPDVGAQLLRFWVTVATAAAAALLLKALFRPSGGRAPQSNYEVVWEEEEPAEEEEAEVASSPPSAAASV